MVNSAVLLLHHVHFDQRDRTVQECFQMGRHGIAVQRKTPDDQVCAAVQVQDPVLVVLDDAMAVSALPAAEAAPAGGNFLFNYVDHADFVLLFPVHTLQESFGQAEGITFFLGASVQYQYLHIRFLRLMPR